MNTQFPNINLGRRPAESPRVPLLVALQTILEPILARRLRPAGKKGLKTKLLVRLVELATPLRVNQIGSHLPNLFL